MQMSKSQAKRLKQWDREYIWHPFTQMKDWLREKPLIIDSADGIYLKDIDGNIYMDGVSSLWVNVHGHAHVHINTSLVKQIDKLSHSTLLGLSNTPAIELAKRLVDITPHGLRKVFYSDNGSTAVEIAIKMAYQYWQNTGEKKKTYIVHLANSYHGDTLGSVSVGGIDLFSKVYHKLIFKTITLKGSGWEAVENLEKLLKARGNNIAALVVEPLVQGAAGMLVWPEGSLKKMRNLTKKYNVFLIVDEVATGFGRTGKMFACQHEGVSPDFLCLAKGITGGYLPMAATLTTQKVYEGFLFDYKKQKTFFHGHTYTGNPLSCAAALANLEIFKKERTLIKLVPKIKFLAKKLKMFYNLPSVAEVRQKGFMVGIELKGRLEDRLGVKVCQHVRKYGVILRPLGNVIVLMPPLSISIEELDYLLMATYRAVQEVA
jgi:adenosylmethionine-8-amino-7-oxononanoate aminotransferase